MSRVEFETILQEGQVEAVADAKIAYDSYEAAIKDVKAAMTQMTKLEARSKKTVAKLTRNFEKAKQTADHRRVQHHPPGECRIPPGVQASFSFVDSWGRRGPGTPGAHKGSTS